ncbi:hypothetical protein [Limnochorda pilosa]|uniref:IrrE N-terminal-like domain-containing protein n=1 Tax=Limnochorda pilosa TaxID=1555112 RepID=A0A0K2SPW1_LIMPI|nr:hypothetical protein [Limnochorda pilosa]BAS29145.1 hypothetical protein LIP_3332 [Limnochorda pilosa]
MTRPSQPPGSPAARFPQNAHLQGLLQAACRLEVNLEASDVAGQWLYRPDERTLYVWEPDLENESLSFLVVILAHELGHVLDFDEKPHYREVIRTLHWSQVPEEIERSAFIRGFRILEALGIPVSLEAYLQMIEEPVAAQVGAALRAGEGVAFPDGFLEPSARQARLQRSCG